MKGRADIVVPVSRGVETTRACLASVYRLSGDATGRVIAVHDPSPEAAMLPMLGELQDEHPDLVVLCNETRLGFDGSCNRALVLSERDVVLLRSDTLVTEGWLEEMIDVLHDSDRIASVAPLCLDRALDLRGTSIPRSSDVPASLGPCLLFRYWVLNVIGGFDLVFGRSDDAQIDWAMRAQYLGLRHVRANRAVVLGSGSFTEGQAEMKQGDAPSLLLGRHPLYLQQLQGGLAGAEVHAAEHFVSSKLGPLRVFIDLRSLGPPALSAAEDLARHLAELPDIEVELGEEDKQDSLQRFQVVYRPGAIDDPRDLAPLLESPRHLVLGIDDLRPYDIPALFASPQLHLAWRALLFSAAHSAQAVVTLSNHDRATLIADLALDPALVEVVPPPIDVTRWRATGPEHRRTVAALGIKRPFFLSAGPDFPNQNLDLLFAGYAHLREQWSGGEQQPGLVLVGPAGFPGGLYSQAGKLPQDVRYLGDVSDPQFRALLHGTSAVVDLSASTGFPLPIAQAMAVGTPIVAARLGSLPEVTAGAALLVEELSPQGVAQRLLEVCRPGTREALAREAVRRIEQLSLPQTAVRLASIFRRAVDHPSEKSLRHRKLLANFARSMARQFATPSGRAEGGPRTRATSSKAG